MNHFFSSAQEFLPWLVLASIAGCFNSVAAYMVLAEDCKKLAFFEPHKAISFWFWLTSQLLIPSIGFWIIFSLYTKPSLDISSFIKSMLFGVSFITIVNSTTTTVGPVSYSIKPAYDFFVRLVRKEIDRQGTGRNAELYVEFKSELRTVSDANIIRGLEFLEFCFSSDVSLEEQDRVALGKKVAAVKKLSASQKEEKINKIIPLVMGNVCRPNVPKCFKAFECSNTLSTYNSISKN